MEASWHHARGLVAPRAISLLQSAARSFLMKEPPVPPSPSPFRTPSHPSSTKKARPWAKAKL